MRGELQLDMNIVACSKKKVNTPRLEHYSWEAEIVRVISEIFTFLYLPPSSVIEFNSCMRIVELKKLFFFL